MATLEDLLAESRRLGAEAAKALGEGRARDAAALARQQTALLTEMHDDRSASAVNLPERWAVEGRSLYSEAIGQLLGVLENDGHTACHAVFDAMGMPPVLLEKHHIEAVGEACIQVLRGSGELGELQLDERGRRRLADRLENGLNRLLRAGRMREELERGRPLAAILVALQESAEARLRFVVVGREALQGAKSLGGRPRTVTLSEEKQMAIARAAQDEKRRSHEPGESYEDRIERVMKDWKLITNRDGLRAGVPSPSSIARRYPTRRRRPK